MAIVVRTVGHHPIDVFHRGGFDVDDHFALARFWIREFLEARWFSKRTQYGSFHGHLIFFFPLIASRPEPRDGSGLTPELSGRRPRAPRCYRNADPGGPLERIVSPLPRIRILSATRPSDRWRPYRRKGDMGECRLQSRWLPSR